MKFAVSKTSDSEDKPCEEAFEDKYTHVHVRTCATFEEFDRLFSKNEGKWESKGSNHRLVPKGIARDEEDRTGWFVNIDSLQQLIEFKNKYGNLILTEMYNNESILQIEIYDDYRE